MLPWPRRGNCTFPVREGRSPKNEYFASRGDTTYTYTSKVILLDWQGSPISGWPKERLSLDITGCTQDTTGNLPEADSDASGKVTWRRGVDTGGSCVPDSTVAVKLMIDYGDSTGFHLLHAFDSITSPDENGDGHIWAGDQSTFLSAYMTGNVYKADMNGDGVVNIKDFDFFMAHKNAQ